MIKINHLSHIEILYIFYDDELIDLTNVKMNQFFIYESQTFTINFSESQIGFLIYPSESVLNGEINFYLNGTTEKFKSRELETDKTCFYIEKINNTSQYFIILNVSDYIVYKFIIMENFEIINETKNRIVPHNSTKYFIFPYNEKKIQNNDYYYGINIGYNNLFGTEVSMTMIKESKNYTNFPLTELEFLLLKNHFITKLISLREDDFEIETYYSKTIRNNIKIFTNDNPEIMNIFTNKEIYVHPDINEYLLIYDVNYGILGYSFNGEGSFEYYDQEVNFEMIENGLNYESKDTFSGYLDRNYIFIHFSVNKNKYYQLNIYPELVNINLNLDSYYLVSEKLTIDKDVAISLKSDYTVHREDGIKIEHNGEITKILLFNGIHYGENLTEIFKKENEELDISSIGRGSNDKPRVVYMTKKYENESILIFGSNKYLKLTLPYLKNDSIIYTAYGYKKDDDFYTNHLIEYKPSEYYDKEVRFYFDDKKYFDLSKIKLYGFDKNIYQDKIKYEEFELYKTEDLENNKFYVEKKGVVFINIYQQLMINKCKNNMINIHLGGKFKFYFDKEITESTYFDFSKYSKDDILEIEANEDYLIFPGIDNRKDKNITSYDEIYKNTLFYSTYKEIDYSILNDQKLYYIFAPKTDYYMNNFKDECFLFKICEGKIIDKNILKTEGRDFKNVLNKDYKEYIVTIAISGKNSYMKSLYNNIYYFYNPIVIKVSQEVLDDIDKTDYGFWTPFKIAIAVTAIIVFLIFIITLHIKCRKKYNEKLNNSSNMIEKLDEKLNLID